MKIYSDQRLGVLDGGRELVVRDITKEDRGDWTFLICLWGVSQKLYNCIFLHQRLHSR